MEKSLKIRLTHKLLGCPSIAVLNLPREDEYMSPKRMRALAEALNKAAADSEAKIKGKMLSAPLDLEYGIHFLESPLECDDNSLMIKMVNTFGVSRFTSDELDEILNPNRHPGFHSKDFGNAERTAASMVRRGIFAESPGSKGGSGWVLTDAAVASAKRQEKLRHHI